jgi:Tol biopolymer transport system component
MICAMHRRWRRKERVARGAVVVVGLVVVAVAAAALARDRKAAPSPTLVYAEASSFSGLASTIWRADIDGKHGRELVEGSSPQLSPDGKLVAFTRWTDSPRTSDILVVGSSGGSPVVIEHLAGDRIWVNNAPVWAPDSRHLVVAERAGVVLLDAQSKMRRVVVPGRRNVRIETLSFSPDSRFFTYGTVDATGGDVYVKTTSGGRPRRITYDHRSFMPLWGRNGIAFNRGGFTHGDIWLMTPTGGRARQLTHTRAGIYPAYVSADGARLLGANPPMHNGRLWAVDVMSGRARDLTGWRGDLFPQGLSRDGTTILAAIGCGGTMSPFGVVETLPFRGGEPSVIVRGPCRASWNR